MRLLSTLFLLLVSAAAAAQSWPAKPVHIVVAYPPGGGIDVLARQIGDKLSSAWGQPVIVENKPGAGTAIGAGAVANAKPDGYTLLVSSNSTFTMNPALQSKLPYDPVRSFDAIGVVGSVALAVLVNPNVPANSVQQLVAAAKAHPDKFVYGSFGNGTSSNFAGAMFNAATGLKMMHVPYRGSAPLMTDLIGGQVPVSFDTVVAAAPQLQGGKIRVLAVTSAKRSALLPNVPTVAESGYPGFDMSAWIAVVAPHGLPPDVRARLEKAFAAMLASPDTQEKMKAAGFEPGWQQVPDWAGFVTTEIARMKAIAERAQIKLD